MKKTTFLLTSDQIKERIIRNFFGIDFEVSYLEKEPNNQGSMKVLQRLRRRQLEYYVFFFPQYQAVLRQYKEVFSIKVLELVRKNVTLKKEQVDRMIIKLYFAQKDLTRLESIDMASSSPEDLELHNYLLNVHGMYVQHLKLLING